MRNQETPGKHTIPNDTTDAPPTTPSTASTNTNPLALSTAPTDTTPFMPSPESSDALPITTSAPMTTLPSASSTAPPTTPSTAPKLARRLTPSSAPTITLFVYGTLKRGFSNHDRYCRNAIDIQPAVTWGRLYQLPAGYPALEVPESAILAHGTSDPLADSATQARLAEMIPSHTAHIATEARPPDPAPRDVHWPSSVPPSPEGSSASDPHWDLVHGELLTFPDPARDLPPIDRLEGFHPGSASHYTRVLIPVEIRSGVCLAWVYSGGRILDAKEAQRIAEFRKARNTLSSHCHPISFWDTLGFVTD